MLSFVHKFTNSRILKAKMILVSVGFLYITYCILVYSRLSMYYAALGLDLWLTKMIPALFPFMVISGLMIRLNLTEQFVTIIYPLINPFFRVSKNVCYCMLIGFLCGFPLGARTVADMYRREKINYREAEYLLSFVNNIGPVYFTGFVLPLLCRRLVLPYVVGMYGIPLIYGLILRHTFYRDLPYISDSKEKNIEDFSFSITGILYQTDDAVGAALKNITALGGYMIIFNLLNIIPHVILNAPPTILAPLFEISGGLSLLGDKFPLYSLLLLPFGGLCCIAQTYTCIKDTGLSISAYTMQKIILTALTAAYYLLWHVLFPKTFLL